MKTKIAFAMAGAAVIMISAVPQSAEAASLTWKLDGILSDNSSVTGRFIYDDATNTYSDVSIIGKFGTYTGTPEPGASANGFEVALTSPLRFLSLAFAESLAGKSLGSTVLLDVYLPGPISYESQGLPTFTNVNTLSFVEGSSVTAVPTPALLPGLIGLGVAALRRKDEESAEENA